MSNHQTFDHNLNQMDLFRPRFLQQPLALTPALEACTLPYGNVAGGMTYFGCLRNRQTKEIEWTCPFWRTRDTDAFADAIEALASRSSPPG